MQLTTYTSLVVLSTPAALAAPQRKLHSRTRLEPMISIFRGSTVMAEIKKHDLIEQALFGCDAFSATDPAVIQTIASGARARSTPQDEIVVHRGDRPAGMFVVVQGEVKQFLISNSGAERIVRLAGAGDCFCEDSVFGNTPCPVFCQTTRASVLLFIPSQVLLTAASRDFTLARALLDRMANRIGALIADIELCEQRSGAQRVAHYLIKHASAANEQSELKLTSSKQTIASQLNMTPENFSRVLHRLTLQGLIMCSGHRAIRLTDLSGLRTLAA